jgi:type IX secretion system PorP/SprF family membrane protein
MNRFNRLLVLGSAVIPFMGKAQQDPYYTHYAFNKILYNPAYAGASGSFCINGIAHRQWLGLQDGTGYYKTQDGQRPVDILESINPTTNGFGFSAPINIKGSNGAVTNYGGAFLSFVNDVVAYQSNTYLRGGLAGAYNMANGSTLRIGLDFTSITRQIDGSKLRAHQSNDPLVPTSKVGDTKVELGAGLWYTNPAMKDLYVGLSMTHINPKEYQYTAPSGSTSFTKSARHIYVVAGMNFQNFMGNPALSFDPSIMIKTVMGQGGFVKPQFTPQGMVTWNNTFSGGLSLRAQGFGMDAASILLGYYPPIKGNAPNGIGNQLLRIGYSYDITLQSLRRASNGTHELQVNYCFKLTLPERPEKVFRHPRYMDRSKDLE